ncbi:hypothetical protein Aperf_G00000069003 [Anoplocephala perfoliata]
MFCRIYVFAAIIGCSTLPFVLYQYYAAYLYCFTGPKPPFLSSLSPSYPGPELAEFAQQSGFLTPYTVNATIYPVWCSGVPWSSYNLLQKHFWNVGAFNYYELKQLPNFLLALPVLTLAFKTICLYIRRAPKTFLSSGILAETDKQRLVLPHIYHLIFLSLYGVINVNIQVLTRMLFSSCPVLYWYCASVLLNEQNDVFVLATPNKKKFKKVLKIYRLEDMLRVANPSNYPPWSSQQLLLFYFYAYIFVGCFMHSNFLPWT